MSAPQVIIAHPVRTAIGAYSGALKGAPATELRTSIYSSSAGSER